MQDSGERGGGGFQALFDSTVLLGVPTGAGSAVYAGRCLWSQTVRQNDCSSSCFCLDVQWDWEAILAPSAEDFWRIIKPWLLPNLQVREFMVSNSPLAARMDSSAIVTVSAAATTSLGDQPFEEMEF